MDRDLSDISLSFIYLYEEFMFYLLDDKKIKLSKVPIVKNTKIYNKEIKKNKSNIRFQEFLKYFEHVIKSRFSEEFLHNYYDNKNDLTIISTCFQLGDFIRSKIKYAGRYNVVNNVMVVNIKDEDLFYGIYHELFHMASTNRMNMDKLQTGFSVYKNGIYTGKGLNEGYTDYLANRYFANVGFKIGYPLEFLYASRLEKIVGKEKMEELYMSSDPQGLISELEKYDSQDNIIDFIKMLDNASSSRDNYIVQYNRYGYMAKYLITWFVKKELLDGKNIYDPEEKQKIIEFTYNIPATFDILDHKDVKINLDMILNTVIEELTGEYINTRSR